MLRANEVAQKFYASGMKKGCVAVAFYNLGSRTFSQEEIDRMIECAKLQFSDIPWQASPDGEIPYTLFVWVEISDDILDIGVALTGDQARVGYSRWSKENGYDRSPDFVCSALEEYANGWRRRSSNISDPEEVKRKLDAFLRRTRSS